MQEKSRIKVIVPFHNPGHFFELCINSVLTQDFDGYDVLFIDDASTDGSYEKIPACTYQSDEKGEPIKDENGELVIQEKHPLLETTKCDRVNAWKANQRMTALPNLHNGIMNFCQNSDDIVFILYGDDWLPNKNSLKKVYEEYEKTNCLMTYGSARLSDGKKSYSASYTEKEFQNVRMVTQKFTWPLTFRKSLYDRLMVLDPKNYHFTDKKGNWFKMCSMHALAYPLMETAGHSKVSHIADPIYMYNFENPLNGERSNPDLFYETQDEIQSKKPIENEISDSKQ